MYNKDPDCDACMPVQLRRENELTFRIYQQAKNQLILAGMEGVPLDVNIPALKVIMERYGCWGNWTVFDRVVNAIRLEISGVHEKRMAEKQQETVK